MKRYELYVDNDNRLVVSEFKTTESLYESKILKGKETFELIKNLTSSKIIEVYEEQNYITIQYKNHIINIDDCDAVFSKNGTGPILRSLQKYDEQNKLRKVKKKKVKRKNKYAQRRIIAAGLTLVMLGACAANALKKENKQQVNTSSSSSETYRSDEGEFTDLNQPVQIETPVEEEISSVYLDYEDRSDKEKAYITRAYYEGMITKYAKMYGVDPNLAIAVATQESKTGIHTSITDPGGATGLMQIQNDVWIGNNVTAYNLETKQNEVVNVTLDKIQDVEHNIKIGCMILQNSLEYMNYNTLAALQCYNMGYGNMNKILTKCSEETNKSISEILSNVKDTRWMYYRKIISVGDQQYVEKVLSWIGPEIEIINEKTDGSLISLNIANKTLEKKGVLIK